jgi:hypothetical protein
MTDPIVDLWTAQQAGARPPSVAELAERAGRFRNRMRVSNLVEYGFGALGILFFGNIAIKAPDWGVRIASLMIIAGVCIVIRNLWRRRPADDPAALARDARTHYRQLLVARHDALASVGRWYVAPFIPGMVVFVPASVLAQAETVPLSTALLNGGIGTAMMALILGLVLWLNRAAARIIAMEIATLDADPAID